MNAEVCCAPASTVVPIAAHYPAPGLVTGHVPSWSRPLMTACCTLQLASAKKTAPNPAAKQKDPEYYRRFIMEDLKPWKDHGITKVRLTQGDASLPATSNTYMQQT